MIVLFIIYEIRKLTISKAEAARTRGTPLTPDAFNIWRKTFTAELAAKREKAEEDRIRALPPKEREDHRKRKERPTGKQLFENSKVLATSDEALYEEGAEEVDFSKYTREEREKREGGRKKKRKEEEGVWSRGTVMVNRRVILLT